MFRVVLFTHFSIALAQAPSFTLFTHPHAEASVSLLSSIAMAPKMSRKLQGGRLVIPGSDLSLEERRALRGISGPTPSNGNPAVAARSSLLAPAASAPVQVNFKRNASTLGGASSAVYGYPSTTSGSTPTVSRTSSSSKAFKSRHARYQKRATWWHYPSFASWTYGGHGVLGQ